MRYLICFLVLLSGVVYGNKIEERKIGDVLPDFKLKVVNSKLTQNKATEVSLSEILKAQDAAVVVFISKNCPYSQAYHSRYKKLAKEFEQLNNKKIAFLALNSNDTESTEVAAEHASSQGFSFPVLDDVHHGVADQYGAKKTPEVFFLDGSRKLLYHGRIDDDTDESAVSRKDLKLAVLEFTKGQKITRSEADAFGCTIKRN